MTIEAIVFEIGNDQAKMLATTNEEGKKIIDGITPKRWLTRKNKGWLGHVCD